MKKTNDTDDTAMVARLVVKYVSLPPGAGKTQGAIEMMRQHVNGAIGMPNPPKYMFYVAATRTLLRQTLNNLYKVVPDNKHHKIRAAFTKKGQWKRRKSGVAQEILNVLDGKSNNGSHKQPFVRGSILFLTHESFLRLKRHHPTFKHTLVLFDEARKWEELVKTVDLDAKGRQYFDRLFRTTPLMVHGVRYSDIQVLTPRKIPENQKVLRLKKGGKTAATAFGMLDTLHKNITPEDGLPPRMRVYGFFEGHDERRRMIQIGLPSFPFSGFSEVYILSADFETSQMNHFLILEGTRVINRSRWFMDTFSDEGYEKAIKRATARYRYVDLVALTTDKKMPSIGRYRTGGLLLPRQHLVKFGDRMRDLALTSSAVYEAIELERDPSTGMPNKQQRQILKLLHNVKGETDTHAWMLKQAERLVRDWRKANPCDHKALVFLNYEFQDDSVNENLFRMLEHGKAVGNNKYRHSNAVVFLASANPIPRLARLLNALLGPQGYDLHEDHIVDKAIQCLGRGNIRLQGIKDRMLVVLPTEGLATRVAERMNNQATLHVEVTEQLGNYESWNTNTYRNLKGAMHAAKEPKAKKPKLSDEQKKEVAKLNTYIWRAERAGKTELAEDYRARKQQIQSGGEA